MILFRILFKTVLNCASGLTINTFLQYRLSPKEVFVCGLVNFVPAVAYLFCHNLPAAFSQPRIKTFFGLCIKNVPPLGWHGKGPILPKSNCLVKLVGSAAVLYHGVKLHFLPLVGSSAVQWKVDSVPLSVAVGIGGTKGE